MRWRLSKLNWSYGFGELIIVVAGVLIALAVDQWNQERVLRADERDAIASLLSELQDDLSSFRFRLQALDDKEDSLQRVGEVLSRGETDEPTQLLVDVMRGANYGWNQGLANRATFDDLVSSGRLGIVLDTEVRLAIADYYNKYADEHIRIDERETAYPSLSYQLVPRDPVLSTDGIAVETEIEANLLEQQIDELVADILASPIGDHVVAETNLAKFIRTVTLGMKIRAESLIDRLTDYQTEIE